MNILVATCGSRGDVQPMLALALALKTHGHRVVLAAPPENAAFAENHGCPFRPLGTDFMAHVRRLSDVHTLRPAMAFLRLIRHEIANQFAQLPPLTAGADLVLGAALVFALPSVAETLGVPYRFIATCPQLLHSSAHPAVGVQRQGLPKPLNRASWLLSDLFGRLALLSGINRERAALGLRPARGGPTAHLLGENVVVASDPVLGAVPDDADTPWVQTGYVHMEQKGGIGDRVAAFLDAGPPPIYVGFGSMPERDLMRLVPMVLDAAGSRGLRVVFPMEPHAAPGLDGRNFCCAGGIPHARLFSRVAAVVHHGGAGTTATAARAGVPQVVVPHILDQYYWADQVHRLGIGPPPVWRSRLTRTRLAKALDRCLLDRHVGENARRVSGVIKAGHGTRDTVRAVTGVLTKL